MKKYIIFLIFGLILGLSTVCYAQVVSGIITDLFTGETISGAVVQIEDWGTDTTDAFGYYSIGQTGVDPYLTIPNDNIPDKLEVVNILGQRILSKEVSLEDIIGENIKIDNIQNIASGMYPFRVLDKNNQVYASGLIHSIEGSNVSLVPFNLVESRISTGGRSIQSVDSYKQYTVEKDNYLLRETWIEEPLNNVMRNEGIVPDDSLFVLFYNDVMQRGPPADWGTRRWVANSPLFNPTFSNPTFYILDHEINTGDTVPQENMDWAINIVTNYLPVFSNDFIVGQYEIVDSLPAPQTPGAISFFWDYTTPNPGGIGYSWNSNFEIYYGYVRIKNFNVGFGTYLQELTQVLGPVNNSSIILPSVFSSGLDNYTESDLKVGDWLYSRPTWNVPEDKDLNPPD